MINQSTEQDERDDNAAVKRDGYRSDKLAEQATYDDETDIKRRMLRGDETKGDPDERDVAGGPDPAVSPVDTDAE